MLIECSFCHATAKIPEDKEGAKVRCSECGKVYVAREKGTKVKRGGANGLQIGIAIGAVVVIAVFALMYNKHEGKPPPKPPAVVAKEPEVVVDTTGWDSELVKLVRSVYDASLGANEGMLVKTLDGERIAKRLNAADPAAPAIDFTALDAVQKETFLQGIANEMIRGADENAAFKWKPVDGRVLNYDHLDVVVRVTTDQRVEQGSGVIADSRTYDWMLHRADDRSKWKAWSWERFISADEARAMRAATKKKVTKVTLPDGTSLFQAEIRHIDDYPDTTPEVHAQVEQAIATMLDFKLRPKENNLARDQLVAIGRAAIPQLLNKFADTKIVDTEGDDSLTQINMVYDTLKRITGYESGFTPLPGQNEERRTMALKAYFAWWERKGKNFKEQVQGKDLLEELIVPTERDKREIEKEKAKSGGK